MRSLGWINYSTTSTTSSGWIVYILYRSGRDFWCLRQTPPRLRQITESYDSPWFSGERLVEINLPLKRLSEPALTTNGFAPCRKSQTHGRVLKAHTAILKVTVKIILNLERILWTICTSGADTEGSRIESWILDKPLSGPREPLTRAKYSLTNPNCHKK